MQKSFLPNFINDINGDHVWRFEKIQNFQLQRFVDNDRYLKSLNQQNSQILEELDRRTAKILEFGNRINEFEYQLNEREGNALRLLAEPELDYTPKREQIRELEAGIRQLESTYKPLPFEPLRNQINEIIEKTATVEAECIEREINLDFRKGKYNLNVLLTRPLKTVIDPIKKPEFKETEVSFSFEDEKARMEKLHTHAEGILKKKLRVQELKRQLQELQQQKDETIIYFYN